MAAKSKAPAKAAKGSVAKKATVTKAKPKGLQLSSAQLKAYDTAYNAAAQPVRQAAQLRSAATGFRKYRLNAAYATIKQANNATRSAQAAAIAANAARMSWSQSKLAHQNSALQARIELDMYNHANIAGKLQYAQAGEKAYAHSAVMRTVDQTQAMSHEAAVFKKFSKNAKKAGKSTLKSRNPPLSKAIAAAGKAAGTAAEHNAGDVKAAAKALAGQRVAKQKASRQASVKKATASATQAAAKSAKKAPAPAKTRTATRYGTAYAAAQHRMRQEAREKKPVTKRNWIGDEFTPNCVITAVANHLLHIKGIIADEASIRELTEACPEEPTIEEVLWEVWLTHWPRNSSVHLKNYEASCWRGDPDVAGLVVGYSTEHGDHAALSLADGKVVSWGSVSEREADIEEAWD